MVSEGAQKRSAAQAPSSLSDFGLDMSQDRGMSNFVECDRDQAFLLPPDLRDWLPADDLGHFVIEAVERVDLGAFKVNHRGTGSAQYHPRMMLALLIYCYANGIFSSRRIERATHRDIGVRFVAANRHPDHDTIARFRRENFAAVSESFLQVLLLAKELKLLRVGLVSIDGSKFKANANKHRSVRYERAGALIAHRTQLPSLRERGLHWHPPRQGKRPEHLPQDQRDDGARMELAVAGGDGGKPEPDYDRMGELLQPRAGQPGLQRGRPTRGPAASPVALSQAQGEDREIRALSGHEATR